MKAWDLNNEWLSVSRKLLLNTCYIPNHARHFEDAKEAEGAFKQFMNQLERQDQQWHN